MTEAALAASVLALLASDNAPTQEKIQQAAEGIITAHVLFLLSLIVAYSDIPDGRDWTEIASESSGLAADLIEDRKSVV